MATAGTGPYFVGIDCGSQSAKVSIVDSAGQVVASGQRLLRPMHRPQPGVVVHPDDDLWDAIGEASRAAMAAFDGDHAGIAAAGLCTIRCCKAFVRDDGTLVEPVISWMDDRAYRPYRPADPSTRWALTTSGHLGHRLTGVLCDTAADHIEMQWPVDADTWNWTDDDQRVDEMGFTRDQLPHLQSPGDVIGTVTADAAAHTGLPVGLRVVTTANDKAVEMLGAGTVGPRTALLSLGTYICAMVHGTANHRSPEHFWTNFAAISNRYLYESVGVRRGMWTMTWWLDLLGPEFADTAAARKLSREAFLEPEAAEVPAGSDGLVTVLDWLAPTDAPFRRGSMLGFDARHTRGHVYRSIIESIAMTMAGNVDRMCGELGIVLDDVVVTGGGANSRLFMQIIADAFGIPAHRCVGGAGAALGAAMIAATSVGAHPSVEASVAAMTPNRETFAPSQATTDIYRRIRSDALARVHATTDPFYEALF